MNPKAIEVQSVTIQSALNALMELKREVMEIITDSVVDQHIQPDTTAILAEFDGLESALISAGNFVNTTRRVFLEQKYVDQFEIIDGLSQHPSGLPFEEWLKVNELIVNFGQPKDDEYLARYDWAGDMRA